jgi:clan AA aspartic protease, TIGR02281 family
MLKLAALAIVSSVMAVGAAEALNVYRGPAPELRAAVAMAPEAAPQSASVAKAGDGHYWAEAEVNGARVRFLVDTGASAVALTLADARRLGIETERLDYAYNVVTASGQARAAAVTLGEVSVAGARIKDVQALVIEDGLESSLLGMSYLGRLASFEATRTSLILRP